MGNHHIANVRITFKESIGVQDRAGYFDSYGIIRDIMQNHLMQVLSLIAMEAPASLGAEDVRDEKVKVLKQIRPIEPEDCVVGQYIGYQDDEGIQAINRKKGYPSRTPTFAVAVLYPLRTVVRRPVYHEGGKVFGESAHNRQN